MALAVFKEPAKISVTSGGRALPLEALVDEGAELDARMKLDALRMAEIKTTLVEQGPGEYFGTKGGRAQVIFPSPRIAQLKDETEAAVAEKTIGKPAFGMLFERVILWKPVKSCRDVAARILAPAKLKKFFELTEQECPAQVRFG